MVCAAEPTVYSACCNSLCVCTAFACTDAAVSTTDPMMAQIRKNTNAMTMEAPAVSRNFA